MNECYIRHLPVVEGENLVGMVSIGDLVKVFLTGTTKNIDVARYKFVQPD